MAELTIITFPEEPAAFDIGAQPEAVAASAGGDTFRGTASPLAFWVENTSGFARTVTLDAVKNCNFGVDHDAAVSVPDGFEGLISREIRADRFVDATGMVSVTYDNEVGLRVAAVHLGS